MRGSVRFIGDRIASMKTRYIVAAAALALPLATQAARADDAPAAPAKWSDTLKIGAQVEAGIVGNFNNPKDNLNYGQLYTDRANTPVFNQGLLSIGRPVDPKATDYDVGFKVQGMFGTDARYTHFMGVLTNATKAQNQFDLLEASVTAHTPWLTDGGVDLQAGLWPTLLGFETIDASTNPFYSHSYIFNFGLPVKHAGANGIIHATGNLDLYLGVDSGNQTTPWADNNDGASFLGGVKLTLLDGNFSVLALTHYGPEDATKALKPLNAGNYKRSYNDVIITYKASDALTLTTELNYIKEDAGLIVGRNVKAAEGGGIAQYAAYTLTDTWTLNARAEAFIDTRSYFVAAFPASTGAVNALEGNAYAVPAYAGTGRNTYGALTAGATYKPALPDWAGSVAMLIRPELRVDNVLSGNAVFDSAKDRTAVTASADIVLTY